MPVDRNSDVLVVEPDPKLPGDLGFERRREGAGLHAVLPEPFHGLFGELHA